MDGQPHEHFQAPPGVLISSRHLLSVWAQTRVLQGVPVQALVTPVALGRMCVEGPCQWLEQAPDNPSAACIGPMRIFRFVTAAPYPGPEIAYIVDVSFP